jgi:SAM-dependent methyltransferase/uncharacterized protein YbaR (Trm112 family)
MKTVRRDHPVRGGESVSKAEHEDRARRVEDLCACPSCHSHLTWNAHSVQCATCGTIYERRDGTPILTPAEVDFLHTDSRWVPPPALTSHPRLKACIDRARSRASMSVTYKSKRSRELVEQFVRSFPPGEIVLNVGAGATRYGSAVVNVDVTPSPEIDIVGVAEALPVATDSCAGLILMAVLEHVQNADKTLNEAGRVLVPGGRMLVDVPFIQGYHASPGDYRRYTEQGLRAEMERFGFDVVDSGVAVGPASAMAWITSEFLALLVSGRSALAYRVARNLTGMVAAPIKYADYWLEGHPMASRIPSAVWVIARLAKS